LIRKTSAYSSLDNCLCSYTDHAVIVFGGSLLFLFCGVVVVIILDNHLFRLLDSINNLDQQVTMNTYIDRCSLSRATLATEKGRQPGHTTAAAHEEKKKGGKR